MLLKCLVVPFVYNRKHSTFEEFNFRKYVTVKNKFVAIPSEVFLLHNLKDSLRLYIYLLCKIETVMHCNVML